LSSLEDKEDQSMSLTTYGIVASAPGFGNLILENVIVLGTYSSEAQLDESIVF
jgi:hypothetical protein